MWHPFVVAFNNEACKVRGLHYAESVWLRIQPQSEHGHIRFSVLGTLRGSQCLPDHLIPDLACVSECRARGVDPAYTLVKPFLAAQCNPRVSVTLPLMARRRRHLGPDLPGRGRILRSLKCTPDGIFCFVCERNRNLRF